MNTRALAAGILQTVIQETRPLDQVLDRALAGIGDAQERAFVQELCFGVMRWYPRLSSSTDKLLAKALKKRDSDIYLLLLLGIYQLDYMRTPSHAAVSATVDACHALNKDWATRLVNAVLRRYQRQKAAITARIDSNRRARFAHPDWLIARIENDWPDQWQSLLAENNRRPPMHLRVNLQSLGRQAYIKLLDQHQLHGEPLDLVASAVRLAHPVGVEQLPGFSLGQVSVQDQGAQLAASLMALKPGARVLDACAAPGGKASHIHEAEPAIAELVAVDRDEHRVALLKATVLRLGTKMRILRADAANSAGWWDGRPFDRILLDAPCSATGVIRRHPDIKMLRQPEQMTSLRQCQSDLLSSLWPLLAPGGRMVYATCSLLHEENDFQIEAHLNSHTDAVAPGIGADWGVTTKHGRQTLPTLNDTDGFYYAVLEKSR